MARLLLMTLAVTALLALSCGGDKPAPTTPPSPVATAPVERATPTPTPTTTTAPTPAQTPEPTVEPSPTPTPAPSPTPAPTPAPTPLPTPTGPPVTLTGPLLVFSDRIDGARETADGWAKNRRVYVYDAGADQYWSVLDVTDDTVVEVAGESLIAWDEGQVRRVGLNGYTEAILFENSVAREVKVSPDGTKVAVLSALLRIAETASGRELLRIWSSDPRLSPLREEGGESLALGDWHADGRALGLRSGDRAAVLILDDERDFALRMLPEGWLPSPDLRYALRWEDRDGQEETTGFDVFDIASGHLVATVSPTLENVVAYSTTAGREWSGTGWWSSPNRYVYFEYALGSGKYAGQLPIMLNRWMWDAETVGSIEYYGVFEPRILDVASGETRPLSRGEWHDLQEERPRTRCVLSNWGRARDRPHCFLLYGGQVVWDSSADWPDTPHLTTVGLIQLAEPITVRGMTPLERWRLPDAPEAPPRSEMIGPLFAWSVQGGYVPGQTAAGLPRFVETRHVMVHDVGTDRTWLAFDVLDTPYGDTVRQEFEWIWPAREGFIVWGDFMDSVRHITVAGDAETVLIQGGIGWLQVSPDGARIAVLEYGGRLRVVDVPSGATVLDLSEEDMQRFVQDAQTRSAWIEPLGASWNSDGSALAFIYGTPIGGEEAAGILGLDGSFALLPDVSQISDLPPEFVTWFERHPPVPSSASVKCPADRALPCRVLLDGEVVGEGRWASVIGFVPLD